MSSAIAGAILNGSNFQDSMKSIMTTAFWSAVSGMASFGVGELNISSVWLKMAAHGASQAAVQGIQGGNMLHGFIAAASSVGGEALTRKMGSAGKVVVSSVIGGTVSEIGGGKFANGAITAAYVTIFNELRHKSITVTSKVKIKNLEQYGQNDCLVAAAEVASGALGNEISQHEWRRLAGGDPNKDMIEDVPFWTDTYTNRTGHNAVATDSRNATAINDLLRTLNNGGVVVLSLAANHAVVVKSITVTLDESRIFEKISIKVMDPSYGKSINLSYQIKQFSDRVVSAFLITK